MAFLSWRDQYRVGVTDIDQEHRYLFGLINEFHDKHRGGADDKALEQILNRLVQYSEEHFRHEEETMLASEYPLHAEHCALHEALFMTLFRLSEELAAGSLRIDRDTHRFLRAWLVQHILKHDLAFSDYLAQRAKATPAIDHNTAAASAEE
ncbi:MAG: McHr [Candidatus Accumulibacter appositus]|uniref:McHr n=1 Tax=Candidatus Accumulibacter appositus TaxID=1454003 RepID=A0A011NA41_9PROT|nr:bacteriohemerythrin [Accumulibacter sp.]EXI79478.1 MAG: McHr [Candidatus Accumulibacter appositus]HRF04843.1 bacteriohemerythrin [Accumulibacter sp.]